MQSPGPPVRSLPGGQSFWRSVSSGRLRLSSGPLGVAAPAPCSSTNTRFIGKGGGGGGIQIPPTLSQGSFPQGPCLFAAPAGHRLQHREPLWRRVGNRGGLGGGVLPQVFSGGGHQEVPMPGELRPGNVALLPSRSGSAGGRPLGLHGFSAYATPPDRAFRGIVEAQKPPAPA